MLKSILLRMLVFTLAFVVGVGSEAIFGEFLKLPAPEKQSGRRPPIQFECTGLAQDAEPLRIFFALYNNSPHSIWFYRDSMVLDYSIQRWVKDHWVDISVLHCETMTLVELKSNSAFLVTVPPFLRDGVYRAGIGVFLDDPHRPIPGFVGRVQPRRVPSPAEQVVIWSKPFKLQGQGQP